MARPLPTRETAHRAPPTTWASPEPMMLTLAVPLAKAKALPEPAIESDAGASHPLGFFYTAKPETAPFYAAILSVLQSQGAGLSQIQPGGVGADIGPLTQRGVPSFAPFFTAQTYFNYHHTAADTLDKIDPKELQEVGSVMAVLAYGLANLEHPLPR